MTKVKLAKKMSITVYMLKTIVYFCQKFEDRCKVYKYLTSEKLREEESKFLEVGAILLQCITQCRVKNTAICGPMLMEIAKKISLKKNMIDYAF